jgi:predicted MFS family arabinose efflux permease
MLDRSGGPIFARQWPSQTIAVASVLLLVLCMLAGRLPRVRWKELKGAIGVAVSARSTWLLLAGCVLMGAMTFATIQLPMFAADFGLMAQVSYIYMAYYAGGLVGLAVGLLARRGNLKAILATAALLQALIFVGLAFLPVSVEWLVILYFFFGASSLTILPVAACFVERHLGALGLPTLVSILWAAHGAGAIAGQSATDSLSSIAGPRPMFLGGAVLCVVAALVYVLIRDGTSADVDDSEDARGAREDEGASHPGRRQGNQIPL